MEVLVLVIGVVADSASATHSMAFIATHFALDSTISLLSQGFKFLDDQTKPSVVHKTEYTLLIFFNSLRTLNEGFPFSFFNYTLIVEPILIVY